jgi:hypothetical protein
LEKRVISLCTTLDNIKPWPGLKTLVTLDSTLSALKLGHLGLFERRLLLFYPLQA